MRAFAAAEADVRAEDDFSGEKKREAAAKTLVHVRETQVAAGEGDFACIVKNEEADWPDDAAIIFGLDKKRVGRAETKIVEGTERGLIVDVAAANRLLQIKRNCVCRAGVSHGEAEADGEDTVETAMAVFGFGKEAMAKIGDKAAERIVSGVGVAKIAVAEAVVELKMLRSQSEMRADECFEMNEVRLRGKARGGLFRVDLADGSNLG